MKTAAKTQNLKKIYKRTKAQPKKRVQTKGWSTERRLAQGERLRRTQIWLKSTGPTSAEGKKRSSQNAFRADSQRQKSMQILTFLRDQNRFLKCYVEWRKIRPALLASKPTFSAISEGLKYQEKMGILLGNWGRKLIVSGIEILEENNVRKYSENGS